MAEILENWEKVLCFKQEKVERVSRFAQSSFAICFFHGNGLPVVAFSTSERLAPRKRRRGRARRSLPSLKARINEDVVPRDGIEPPTQSSSGSRSTTELPRHEMKCAFKLPIPSILSTKKSENAAHCQAPLPLLG